MSRDESDNARRSLDYLVTDAPDVPLDPLDRQPASIDPPLPPKHPVQKKDLTFWNVIAIVVSLQLGSGVFAAPAFVLTVAGSPLSAICVWVLGGLLVWQGAVSLVEFATTLPSNAGIAAYLDFCYGTYCSYLFSFVWILIGRSCANAMVSMILADHLLQAFSPGSQDRLAKFILAFIALNGITAMNTRGTKTGAKSAIVFMAAKLATVTAIVLCGLAVSITDISSSSGAEAEVIPRSLDSKASDEVPTIANLITRTITALFGVVFAFGGWESIGFIAGEVKQPLRILPRAINIAVPLVMLLYVAINLALFAVLKPAQLSHNDAVATTFGQAVFGYAGGVVFAIAVAISCLGALNANIFAVARLTQESVARGFAPPWLIKILAKNWLSPWRNPVTATHSSLLQSREHISLPQAMWLNAAFSNLYLFLSTLRELIVFKGMIEYFFYGITISGIWRLRSYASVRQDGTQSYRVPIVFPIVFCLASAFLVLWQATSATWILLMVPVVLLVTSVAYYFTQSKVSKDYLAVEQDDG